MHRVLRHYPIAVAVSALCGLAVVGCASKPPAVDTTAADATVAASATAQAKSPSGDPESGAAAATVGAAATPAASAAAGGATALTADSGVTAMPAAGASGTGSTVAVGAAATSDGVGAGSALPPARGQTSDERRAALDKRLSDSLGSFDAKLRTEQQKIAKERDARQVSVATISNSDNGNSDAGAGGRSSSSPGDRRSDRTAGDLKSDKSSGSTNAAGNGAVAKEIPDGNDDDVVARRLRKAAEQETDPELKDKLWKEYVEYKKNTQGK